ncbi:hypothetical protein VA7868_00396 [Vibrio aerogenes CECT 7868]|uniref:Uncharacterized protein n=1 Tax=Vibrio aerogenes CECT 7868 TaxID=1216006 RepID=A0A1M5VIU8_9VIBR|nr:hypothetical protein [Vibrio aerogenes]SHH74823.1 hypothetical protein VA7868_00396 [Vibrio aerogenes CECT 7868]
MSYYHSGSGRDPEINAAVSDLTSVAFRLSHQYILPGMARGAFTREIASKAGQIVRIYEHGNIEKPQALSQLKNLGWKLRQQGDFIARSGIRAVAAMMQQHRGGSSLDSLHINRYIEQTTQEKGQTGISGADMFRWSHLPHARESSLLRYAAEAYFKRMKPAIFKNTETDQSAKSSGSGGGGSFLSQAPEQKSLPEPTPPPAPEPKKLTVRERLAKQRQQNLLESDKAFAAVEAKEKADKQAQKVQQKQAQQKNAELKEKPEEAFSLGWMQTELPMSQGELWDSIFAPETEDKHKALIKKHNAHLNEPVMQGELVIVLTREPETEQEQQQLDALKEEAQAGSEGLGKLDEAQAATVYRHFELLDYYASNGLKYIQENGLPSDDYAYASVGVGAVASGVETNLKHINNILMEINDLYVEQVAMASRTGGMNYGTFVAQRAELLQKLDIPFARFSSRTVKIPILRQIRRTLKLSTKSVFYHADEIIAKGVVPNLGKRIANISHGLWAAKGVGYLGLGLAVASGAKNVYDACSVDGSGNCGQTATREVTGFLGGWVAGGIFADIALGGVFIVLSTASAPVFAIVSVSAFVGGGIVGGIVGSSVGKAIGDIFYEKAVDIKQWGEEKIEELF